MVFWSVRLEHSHKLSNSNYSKSITCFNVAATYRLHANLLGVPSRRDLDFPQLTFNSLA